MPAANLVPAEILVLAANFVLAGIFVPTINFVLAAIFLLAEIFVPAANFVLVLFVLLLYVPKSTTLAMARRSVHLITSFLGKLEEAVNQYFVMGARVLDLRPSGRGLSPTGDIALYP